MNSELTEKVKLIFEKGLKGSLSVEQLIIEWPDSDIAVMEILYEDLEDAIAHAPGQSISSKKIDFQKWEVSKEYCVAYFDFLTIDRFFQDEKWVQRKISILSKLDSCSKASIENLVKNLVK